MSIKSFFLKQILRAKGVSKDQVDIAVTMWEKDPELFKKIAGEIDAATKAGKNQKQAMMEIAQKYKSQFKNLM